MPPLAWCRTWQKAASPVASYSCWKKVKAEGRQGIAAAAVEEGAAVGGVTASGGAAVADVGVEPLSHPRVHVEPPVPAEGRVALEQPRQEGVVGAGEEGQAPGQRPRRDRRVPGHPLLAGQAVDAGGLLDHPVEQTVDLLQAFAPLQDGADQNAGYVGGGEVRLDLRRVLQGVAQDAGLDVGADRGARRLRRGDLPAPGLLLHEGQELAVLEQRRPHLVPGQDQALHLLAGVVPGRHVAAVGLPLVEDGLLAEVEGRVDVGDAVEEHAGLAGVTGIAGGRVRRGQPLDAVDDEPLPLPVDQPGADEPPAAAVAGNPAAVVDAEVAQRVTGVGVPAVEQQAPVGAVRVEEAGLVQAGLVEGGEVVLREALAAVGAAQLPGLGEGVDLPRRTCSPAGGRPGSRRRTTPSTSA